MPMMLEEVLESHFEATFGSIRLYFGCQEASAFQDCFRWADPEVWM